MKRINLNDFIKKSKALDSEKKFKEADNLFEFVKTSQTQVGEFPLTPEQYSELIPTFQDEFLSYNLNPKNAPASTFGKSLVDRSMYDQNSAFYQGEGPDKAYIAKNMPSEKQYAKLLNEGKFDEIARIKKSIGAEIQEYLSKSNVNIEVVATLIDQYLLAESPAVRESFIQYVLPTTIVGLVSDNLAATNMKDWSKQISKSFSYLESKDQLAFGVLSQNLSKNLQKIIDAKKTTPQGRAEVLEFFKSNDGKMLATKYGLRP